MVVHPRVAAPGAQADPVGAVAYEGERHGRHVSIRLEGPGSTTALGGAVAEFEVVAKGERLRAADGAPPAVAAELEPLRASASWKAVSVTGGAGGIVAERKRDAGLHWMRDLWLAERLAEASAGA